MKDFSNIPININFIGGAFVDIQDSSSENNDEYTRVIIREEIDKKLIDFNFEEIL
jgi:hypothetical protein